MTSPIVDYSVSPVSGDAPLVTTITLNSVIVEGFDLQPYSVAHFGAVDESGMLNGFQLAHFGYYISLPSIGYLWDFGDGDSFLGPQPPTHTYKTPGTYILRLIISVDSTLYQYPTIITARSVLSKLIGIGQNPLRESLAYGNDETQGVGWSTKSGDGHLWPDTYGSLFSLFNSDGDHEKIVYDSIDSLPYIYDTRKINTTSLIKEVWKDRVNPLDESSGTEITTRVRLQEYRGSHESYFQQMSDINLFYQPIRRESQNAIGYTAKGLRDAFEVDLELYADEKLEKVAHANNVPIERELFFDRKVKGHILQIAFETSASQYRFTRSEVYLTNYDHAVWQSQPKMTEKTYQFNADHELLSWLTRTPNLLLDNNGIRYGDTNDSTPVGGADGYGASAFKIINNPSNLVFDFLPVLPSSVKFITVWSTNQNGPIFNQIVQPNITVVGDLDARIDPDDSNNVSTQTWYFLYISALPNEIIQNIEFINGDSYFDLRVFNDNSDVGDSDTLNYIFNDVEENKGNSICPSWF